MQDIRDAFKRSPAKKAAKGSLLESIVERLPAPLAHPDPHPRSNRRLKKSGLVTDDLSLGARQYHGVVRLTESSPFRRLDLLLFPPEEYACALLHFTGSGGFNRHMRAHALEQGFTLNEKGLHKGTAETKGEPVKVTCEADVFQAIGMDWREPEDREMGK